MQNIIRHTPIFCKNGVYALRSLEAAAF